MNRRSCWESDSPLQDRTAYEAHSHTYGNSSWKRTPIRLSSLSISIISWSHFPPFALLILLSPIPRSISIGFTYLTLRQCHTHVSGKNVRLRFSGLRAKHKPTSLKRPQLLTIKHHHKRGQWFTGDLHADILLSHVMCLMFITATSSIKECRHGIRTSNHV